MTAPPGPYPNPPAGGRPPGPRGSGHARLAWALVAVLACALVVVVVTLSPKSADAGHQAPAASRTPAPSASPAAAKTVLGCRARALRPRPRDHTTVLIRVRTTARARVTATERRAVPRQHAAGRASSRGTWGMRLRVGNATPGTRIVVVVHVSRRGQTARCRATLRPRRTAAAARRIHPRSSPTTAPQPSTSPTSAPPPPVTPAGCYPLSDEGTCYEPGEYCRDSDHGVHGIDGNGEPIVCEDNDGWRWEPV